MQTSAEYIAPDVATKVMPLPTGRSGQGKRYDRNYIVELADKMIGWYAVNQAKPKDIRQILLKRFLAQHGHSWEDAQLFAGEQTYFKRALALALQWQEVLVIEHGLSESKGQTTAALVLKNNHGYEEKAAKSEEKTIRLIVQGVGKRKLKDVKRVMAKYVDVSEAKTSEDAITATIEPSVSPSQAEA